jgi:hypothetical protein
MGNYFIVLFEGTDKSYYIYDYINTKINKIYSKIKLYKNQLIVFEEKYTDGNTNIDELMMEDVEVLGKVNLSDFFKKIIRLNISGKFNSQTNYMKKLIADKTISDEDYILVFLDEKLIEDKYLFDFYFKEHKDSDFMNRDLYKQLIFKGRQLLKKENKKISDWIIFDIEKNDLLYEYNPVCKIDIDSFIKRKLIRDMRYESNYDEFSLDYNNIFEKLSENKYIKNLMMSYSVYEIFDSIMIKFFSRKKTKIYKFQKQDTAEFALNYETIDIKNNLVDYIKKITYLEKFENIKEKNRISQEEIFF